MPVNSNWSSQGMSQGMGQSSAASSLGGRMPTGLQAITAESDVKSFDPNMAMRSLQQQVLQ